MLPGTEHGDHPGTGVTILLTGVHGDLTTGTTTMATTISGITIITAITVTGTVTGAGHTKLTITAMCEYTVQPWS